MEFPVINLEFSIEISKDWPGNSVVKRATFPAFHLSTSIIIKNIFRILSQLIEARVHFKTYIRPIVLIF